MPRQVDPQSRPSNIGPPFTGHFRITADTPRGLQAFQPGANAVQTPGKPHPATERAISATPASKADLNLDIRRNIFDKDGKEILPAGDKDKQPNGDSAAATSTTTTNGAGLGDSAIKAMDAAAKEPQKPVHCYSCGIDCTKIRFHYAKNDTTSNATAAAAAAAATTNSSSHQPDTKYDLCPNCFVQGRMPSTHRGSDFVKLEEPKYTTIPDKDVPWTDSEVLLLLEGLETFDDDWASIADHVGTRSREECVMKFLQLEIQDQYLEDDVVDGRPTASGLYGGRLPVTQAENPVMTTVAFMAQMADPSVVAAAAGKSVEAMRKDLLKTLEKGIGGGSSSKGHAPDKAVKGEQEQDNMDVDQPTAGQNTTVDGEVKTAADGGRSAATEDATGNNNYGGNDEEEDDDDKTNAGSTAATIGLSLAAARSGGLASHQEREMTRLVGAAVNLTLQKFELKLQQFSEMEELVQQERRDLDRARQQLFLDRLAFRRRVGEVEDALNAAVSGKDGGISVNGGGGGGGGNSGEEKDGDNKEEVVVSVKMMREAIGLAAATATNASSSSSSAPSVANNTTAVAGAGGGGGGGGNDGIDKKHPHQQQRFGFQQVTDNNNNAQTIRPLSEEQEGRGGGGRREGGGEGDPRGGGDTGSGTIPTTGNSGAGAGGAGGYKSLEL